MKRLRLGRREITVDIDTVRDAGSGVTTVRLRGELTVAGALAVRNVLHKFASECPAAIIADLSGVESAEEAALTVFPAATRAASKQWDVPVVLCGARPGLVRVLRSFRIFADLHESHDDATLAVRARSQRWRYQAFLPSAAGLAAARDLVAQACTDWDLPHLRPSATLLTLELAGNAIRHAGAAFDLRISYTRRYLVVALQDGSTVLPPRRAEIGRGLRVVDAVATSWKAFPVPTGKIVLALLRTGAHRPGRLSSPACVLSDGEREVLHCLPGMVTAAEISAHLLVSTNTVKAHLRGLYRKLHVSRRRDALLRAYEDGLLP